ncbi:MAG: hypothetical protein Q8N15_01335 [Bacillota bacterium]|nr:hypothetical protein [Bacillota bacterium]
MTVFGGYAEILHPRWQHVGQREVPVWIGRQATTEKKRHQERQAKRDRFFHDFLLPGVGEPSTERFHRSHHTTFENGFQPFPGKLTGGNAVKAWKLSNIR